MRALPPISERTFTHAFKRAMDEVPDKAAYIDADGAELTYAQTMDRALRAATAFAALGVEEEQTVALMLDNSVEFITAVYGLGLTRRVQVPVNTAYKGDFLAHILNDCDAEVVVVEAEYAERLALIADQLPKIRHVVVRGEAPPSLGRFETSSFAALFDNQPAELVDAAPDDLMAIMYTSGTTGLSKGVEISHAHAYSYASREDAARPVAEDRILVVLPLFHLAGQWYGAYQSLIARATAVIQPAFSVSKFWGWVRDFKITETVMLGAVAELLQQAEPRPDDADNTLSYAVMAPLASDLETFRTRFDVQLGAVYGMSEIGGVMFTEPEDVVPGEAGMARDGFELRLVDSDGNDVPNGAHGELLVRPEDPALVMRGYRGLPEKTAETIVDGWVHTGDIFKRDDEGHYYFVDRSKDALRRRGENISSFEVERTVNAYPDILECAVVAAPSDLGEDEIKAVVVVREGHELDFIKLTEFMVERMPYFMVPRYIQVIGVLPKTPTQKIQKHLLRDSGVAQDVWDREAAGIKLNRRS
ncbi:crotonobetaine/carnitine-CoA ligase [Nocardioides daedukensis]|uniref:Crotonobetaine/carnitine-CoA ligase n=1 Tax=Nocardioides daedukensis TaxID=634462 RepID=A0A7Y9UPQ7_9ACTN|nr:AMP-binding protein [Nocardioides daedukensis]NYG59848.1 crotonobetaine/carnitine-CoA ligase [Nocardioides daedukensis]